jgi:hypothetical protein
MAIDPKSAGIYYNMGIISSRRGDLKATEEWYRKAVALAPKNTEYRKHYESTLRKQTERARWNDLVTGRGEPTSAAEAIQLAESMCRSPQRRYAQAVLYYGWAFAAEPARADDLNKEHRYKAACLAVLAASGKDEEMKTFDVEEWGYLTCLALRWLRADLVKRIALLKEPKRAQDVRDQLTAWKNDPDLASVRDPAWLEVMTPTDRKLWQALWADVDAAINSIAQK